MSGSADAQVNAILGSQQLVKPTDPLSVMSGWQGLANAKAQNALIQQNTKNADLANQKGQQELGVAKQNRAAQVLYGVNNLPDSQLAEGAQQALKDELASGTIGQQEYDTHLANIQGVLQKSNGNPAALRPLISGLLATTMAGPQAAQFLQGGVGIQNIGGAQVPYQVSGAGSANPNQITFGGAAGNPIANSQSPSYINAGNVNIPVGGPNGTPIIQQGFAPSLHDTGGAITPMINGQPAGAATPYSLSPAQSTAIQPRLVQQPDGSYAVVEKQVGQWNPSVAAPGTKGGPNTPLGSGSYPQPPTTVAPQGQAAQLESDQKLYQNDKTQVPTLTTGTQSLTKALGALNAVATGSGTEGLAKMRAYATSLGNVLGIDTGGVNVQDMNRAELEKYLEAYAAASGTAGRSDEALQSAFKSNASGHINNAAAQDVVRTNIGRDRQSIAATMTAPNPQGSGYSDHKAKFATQTDPRGFAWDTYTEEQQHAMLKEAGPPGSANRNKLLKSVGAAQRLGLMQGSSFAVPNVNAAPKPAGPLFNPPNTTPSLGSPNGQ